MNHHPFVSVVIAMRNEKGYIEKCIDSFLSQSYPRESYEILIYDAGSSDGSRKYLSEFLKTERRIKLFDNPKVLPAAGWNLGFQYSSANYVVMMGGHAFVDKDFLKKNVELMEEKDYPCSGGRVIAIGEDKKSQIVALAFNHPFGVGDARYRYSKKRCLVETVNYGMYRKSVIDQVEPLNETIKRGEDWEFNYQIVRKFGKMIYSPEIKTFYYSRSDFKKLWRRQYDAGKYKLEIIEKYPSSIMMRHIIPFMFALTGLVLIPVTFFGVNILFLFLFWSAYLTTNIAVSFYVALRNKIAYFPYLIWTFFVMQFSYGLGFLVGALKFLFRFLFKIKKLN